MDCFDILFSILVVILSFLVLIWSLKELFIGTVIIYRLFLHRLWPLWDVILQKRTLASLFRAEDEAEHYIYILAFLAIYFSVAGSVLLYQSLLCSGYLDGFKLFQLAFLISLCCSISIMVLNSSVGYDAYEHYIERDVYVQVTSMADYQCDYIGCHRTPVYNIHQEHRCCGWHKPEELASYSLSATPTGKVSINDGKLPLFCCSHLPNTLPNCSLNSTNLFNRTCKSFGDDFWRHSNFDPSAVRPTTFWSMTMKFVLVFGYAIARREMLLPTTDSRFPDDNIGRRS